MAEGIIAALGSDRFEHYVPDMKAVVDVKNADIDTFIAGVAGDGRDGRAMKALVYGVRAGAVRGARERQPADRQPGQHPDGPAGGAESAFSYTRIG